MFFSWVFREISIGLVVTFDYKHNYKYPFLFVVLKKNDKIISFILISHNIKYKYFNILIIIISFKKTSIIQNSVYS